MGRAIPDTIKIIARNLRKNMTKSEEGLWNKVKSKKVGCRILRQAPIYVFTEDSGLDRYIIADFYCPEKKLIIEIDGSVHDIEEVYLLDREKERLLQHAGYNIIRFQNSEVQSNLDAVIKRIQEYNI